MGVVVLGVMLHVGCYKWGSQRRAGVRGRRPQTRALMAEMGVGVNNEMLCPVSASDVYLRSCANLVNQQYRQGTVLCRGAPGNCPIQQ